MARVIIIDMRVHILTVVLLVFFFHRITDGSIELGSEGVAIVENGIFMQKIVHDENITIINCILQYNLNNSWYTIELNLDKPQEWPPEILFGQRLSNLGGGTCGIKISDHLDDDPKLMGLAAIYAEVGEDINKVFSKTFGVVTKEIPKVTNEVKYVMLGSSTELKCSPDDALSCSLVDPDGNEVISSTLVGGYVECLMSIHHITINNIGIWKCYFAISGSVDLYHSTTELKLIDNPEFTTWYKEEHGYGMIGCQNNSIKVVPIDFCQFVNPSNKIFTVFKGSDATERYTSVGTDYEKSICQIEFKLPIQPEEIGNWKCLTGPKLGTFVEVNPNGRTKKSLRNDYAKKSTLYIRLGDQLPIACSVPYPTNNCYIRTPKNEYIYGGDENMFRLGDCNTTVKKAEVTHLGIWTCHISQPDFAEDEIKEIDVREHNTIMSIYKTIDTFEKQSVDLMCEATVPIQSCQYLSPSGSSYNVFPEKKVKGMDYIGRGLNYGDCGLRIENVKPEHDGVWTCVVNNVKDSNFFIHDFARINVNEVTSESTTATAAAIGIPVGIAVVAVFMFAVVLYRRYRKRIRHDDARVSDGSNGVTSTPIINIPMQNIYTTNNEDLLS